MIFVGDLQAGLFDVAKTHIEPFARPPEPLSSFLHGMMLFQHAPCDRVSTRNHLGKWFHQARIIAVAGSKNQATKKSFVRLSEQNLP
jgi:hypothetical protein